MPVDSDMEPENNWVIYAKQFGRWTIIGGPMPRTEADDRVAELQKLVDDFNEMNAKRAKRKEKKLPLPSTMLMEPHSIPV